MDAGRWGGGKPRLLPSLVSVDVSDKDAKYSTCTLALAVVLMLQAVTWLYLVIDRLMINWIDGKRGGGTRRPRSNAQADSKVGEAGRVCTRWASLAFA